MAALCAQANLLSSFWLLHQACEAVGLLLLVDSERDDMNVPTQGLVAPKAAQPS